MSPEPIEIENWSPHWRPSFQEKSAAIRRVLGDRALRIDHIGSTSIDKLAAKPIIDI
ncbi:MAG: GrpB family protein [Roseibium sp.]|nr:GrpB family protein [Roseibium sp.]